MWDRKGQEGGGGLTLRCCLPITLRHCGKLKVKLRQEEVEVRRGMGRGRLIGRWMRICKNGIYFAKLISDLQKWYAIYQNGCGFAEMVSILQEW